MRIGLISDLHVDINEAFPILELTAETAGMQSVDALVIAGDISETQDQTIKAVERLQSLCPFPVYYVPGNHDMWNKNCPERRTDLQRRSALFVRQAYHIGKRWQEIGVDWRPGMV